MPQHCYEALNKPQVKKRLEKSFDEYRVSEVASSVVAQTWDWNNHVAVKRKQSIINDPLESSTFL